MERWKEELKKRLKNDWPLIEKRKQLRSKFLSLSQEQRIYKIEEYENSLLKSHTPEMKHKITKMKNYNIYAIPDGKWRAADITRRKIQEIIEKYIPSEKQDDLRSFLCLNWSVEFYEVFTYFVPQKAFTPVQLSFMKNDIYCQVVFPDNQELITIE